VTNEPFDEDPEAELANELPTGAALVYALGVMLLAAVAGLVFAWRRGWL
jgi:hypothetical protein